VAVTSPAGRCDAAFQDAPGDDFDRVFAAGRPAVAASRDAAASRHLDDIFEHSHGDPACLRRVHLRMTGEYARRNGPADLLRGRNDGRAGRRARPGTPGEAHSFYCGQ
jgi:hypothetical protein